MFESMILHREQAENQVTKHFFNLIEPSRCFLEVKNQLDLGDKLLRLKSAFERFVNKSAKILLSWQPKFLESEHFTNVFKFASC